MKLSEKIQQSQCMAFIKDEKVFDSVHLSAIMKSLRESRV